MSFARFAKVLPRTARVNTAGHLELGGGDLVELAAEHGTPLFVLDTDDFLARLRAYADVFGGHNVHYGAKAFLTRTLVALLLEADVGLDCASGGELYTALSGGFPAERIILHGNNKSEDELRMAVEAGVGRIAVDSMHEVERLRRVAPSAPDRVRVYLRVTPGIEAHTHDYLKTGNEDSKFGMPIGDRALDAIRTLVEVPNVEVVGLHAHIGSQVFDFEPFEEAAATMTAFLAQVRDATGADVRELDLGGGVGIAYEATDEPHDFAQLGKAVHAGVAAEAQRRGVPVPVVKVEPGRSAIGPSMVTLYEVGTIKEVPGVRRYAAVDGGMSDNIRPMLYGARYTSLSATRPDAPHDVEFALCGKLCESGDVMRKDAMLPELELGEIVCVAATGAYGYAMASNYNRLPRPAVVALRDGEVTVLARRETYEDLLRLER